MKHLVFYHNKLNGDSFQLEQPSLSKALTVANALYFAKTGLRNGFDRKNNDHSITSPEGFCIEITSINRL